MFCLIKTAKRKFRLKATLLIGLQLYIVGLFIFVLQVKPVRNTKDYFDAYSTPSTVRPVQTTVKQPSACNDNIQYMHSQAVSVRDVILNPRMAEGIHRGGESLFEVKGQKEDEEYFQFNYGFLNVSCTGNYTHYTNNHSKQKTKVLDSYHVLRSMGTTELATSSLPHQSIVKGLTVAITRKDYANMYWTTVELFNAYFTSRAMNTSADDVNILFLDAHPQGHLDDLWSLLFQKVMRVGWLNESTYLEHLALVPSLHVSPIVTKRLPIPYLDDFRSAVNEKCATTPDRSIDCKNVKITLIVRRDYVAHPRNIAGKVQRKLQNTDELVDMIRTNFHNGTFKAVVMETLSVKQQISVISDTDILIGVHGAGLAHTVWQVPGSGLIELFPENYLHNPNNHFQQLAEWSGKSYMSWYSNHRDTSRGLYVPPYILREKLSEMRNDVCGNVK